MIFSLYNFNQNHKGAKTLRNKYFAFKDNAVKNQDFGLKNWQTEIFSKGN